MSAIRLRGATSGTTDVVAAAIAGDGVLTLPSGTGTLATTAFVNTAVAAGGKVLQVVSVTKVDTFTTTSTSFTDVTGLSANITPTSATSKILILSKVAVNNDGNSRGSIRLLRGATEVGSGTAAGSTPAAMSALYVNEIQMTADLSGNYLDDPETLSEITYKIQIKTNSGTVRVNTVANAVDSSSNSRTSSTITLMEISA